MSNVPAPNSSPEPGQTTEPTAVLPAVETEVTPGEAGAAEGKQTLLGAAEEAAPETAATPFDAAKFEWPEALVFTDEDKQGIAELAGTHKISQEGMSALLERHAKAMEAASDRAGETMAEAWSGTINEWTAAVKTEHGAKFEEVLTKCERVVDEFGGKDLRQALEVTGAGSNPAVIRFIAKMADALGEAKPVNTGGEPAGEKNLLAAMYPSMVSKE